MALRGYFDPIAAATSRPPCFPWPGPPGRRSPPPARRFADAVVEIASHALDSGRADHRWGAHPPPAHRLVETVMAWRERPAASSSSPGRSPPPPCSGSPAMPGSGRILLGPNSAVIDVGRSLRLPGPGGARGAARTRRGLRVARLRPSGGLHQRHHFVLVAAADRGFRTSSCSATATTGWSMRRWQLARVEQGRLLAIPPARGHRSWIPAPDTAASGYPPLAGLSPWVQVAGVPRRHGFHVAAR